MNTKQTKTQSTFRLRAATRAALAAPLILALVALGCGEQKEKASATVASAPAQAQPGAVPAAKTEAALTAETGATSTQGTSEAKTDEVGLPPEVVAVPPEGISAPGTVVTIAAVGSTDVTSVMLTDRVGAKTPFTFDSAANMWKVSYRVPLDVKTDRLALSVTAGTESNRWKRVWVFLQLREEAKEAATAPDSTK